MPRSPHGPRWLLGLYPIHISSCEQGGTTPPQPLETLSRNWYVTLILYWPQHSQMVIPTCIGSWEMQPFYYWLCVHLKVQFCFQERREPGIGSHIEKEACETWRPRKWGVSSLPIRWLSHFQMWKQAQRREAFALYCTASLGTGGSQAGLATRWSGIWILALPLPACVAFDSSAPQLGEKIKDVQEGFHFLLQALLYFLWQWKGKQLFWGKNEGNQQKVLVWASTCAKPNVTGSGRVERSELQSLAWLFHINLGLRPWNQPHVDTGHEPRASTSLNSWDSW